ncbi:hypothetical protein I656_02553 [Geobacillus sp. WSUCF1]|nr:hypothetical protein I656_02553 [Geobacillus sp. WSUCF1]
MSPCFSSEQKAVPCGRGSFFAIMGMDLKIGRFFDSSPSSLYIGYGKLYSEKEIGNV